MRLDLRYTGFVLAIVIGSWGCAAPRVLGRATVLDEGGAGPGAPAPGVTVNFINLGGNIDESVLSVQTDAQGKYQSPPLPPGKYTVEAMLPGYVIGRTTVEMKKHGAKKAPFALKKIHETTGRSLKESETENIPTPGEVKIHPPN
jgi:hypothetical protein